MSNEVVKLTEDEVHVRLQNLSFWTVNNGELQREFSLPSFSSAIFFVNAIAHLAELAAHHPDIHIVYNRVILNLVTHSAGGITEKDFALAQKIDELQRIFEWKPTI
ncbi:MAG: 4a-hydroxytetrahydrobiopterin dehydratase [Ktedonobacteraceae bacterium]